MEKLLEIMEDLLPDEELKGRTGLIEDGVMTSFTILNLISEISDEYDVDIPVEDIIPENFDSLDAIWALIQRYM